MTEETDAELVARVRQGGRDAAGKLVERYLRSSRAVALAILRDIPAAEDVCQDAFVQASERIDDCRDPARFAGWLHQIVRNRARNHLRDHGTGRFITLDDADEPSGEASPAQQAERADLRQHLLEALGELTEEQREVVLLHDLEGWTHREIGERMEMPPGTVRSHLHYARKKLRTLLGQITGSEE
jgi:RNA polymerase sigma-70 factor, ECF subfamily